MEKKPTKTPDPPEPAVPDLDLTPGDATQVKGGAPQKSDGSLDAGLHFKYDIKGNKEG